MVAILLISIFIIGFVSLLIYRRIRPRDQSDFVPALPPAPHPSLFEPDRKQIAELREKQAQNDAQLRLGPWLERARNGDIQVLSEINAAPDDPAYDLVLTKLVERSPSFAELSVLAAFVVDHELPANRILARAVMDHCRHSPDRSAAIMLLHLAARTNDANVFSEAFDLLVNARTPGHLSAWSASELMTLAESEFWSMTDQARDSGAGFLLKQKLADARRDLAAAARNGNVVPES
jgi:hypothetical protein